MKKKILVLAPHADDEVLGCGGTINKLSRSYDVNILILTNPHLGIPKKYSKIFAQNIKKHALKAHKILGVKKTFFFDYPVLGLAKLNGFEISDRILNFLKKIKPEILFLCSKNDLHSDHRIIYESSLVALRNLKILSLKKIFCYETPSESEWGTELIAAERLNYYVELKKTHLEKKILAMESFKSEKKKDPHPRSKDNLRALAKIRGSYVNTCYAEAFSVLKILD